MVAHGGNQNSLSEAAPPGRSRELAGPNMRKICDAAVTLLPMPRLTASGHATGVI